VKKCPQDELGVVSFRDEQDRGLRHRRCAGSLAKVGHTH
jgi:hypothetical protein